MRLLQEILGDIKRCTMTWATPDDVIQHTMTSANDYHDLLKSKQ